MKRRLLLALLLLACSKPTAPPQEPTAPPEPWVPSLHNTVTTVVKGASVTQVTPVDRFANYSLLMIVNISSYGKIIRAYEIGGTEDLLQGGALGPNDMHMVWVEHRPRGLKLMWDDGTITLQSVPEDGMVYVTNGSSATTTYDVSE